MLNVETGAIQALTSDRYNSVDPTWSSDGKWLYFLSDRALNTTVHSPWGPREPEPHFDRPVKIYELALSPECVRRFCRRMNFIPMPRKTTTRKPTRSRDDKADETKKATQRTADRRRPKDGEEAREEAC